MKIVIPMAGRGQRFLDAGYVVPKPLITIRGYPMVWWAVRSLPVVPPADMIFIVRADHVREHSIDIKLKELFSPEIAIVPQYTQSQGQADTVLLARQEIRNASHLVIYNCDTYAPRAGEVLQQGIEAYPQVDGFVVVFNSSEPNLSFVRTAADGHIVEVAEKRAISCDATIGLYHFRTGEDFIWAADKMISENDRVRDEFYVLPVYRYLIERGKKFRKLTVEDVHILGTPQLMKSFGEQGHA